MKHTVETQRCANNDYLQVLSVSLAKHRMTEGPVSFLVTSGTVYNSVTTFAFEHFLLFFCAKIAFFVCEFFLQDLSLVFEPHLPVLNHWRKLRIRDVHLTFWPYAFSWSSLTTRKMWNSESKTQRYILEVISVIFTRTAPNDKIASAAL